MSVDFDPQIPFVQEDQKGDFMCWIAVAVSVKRHFDPSSKMRQCGFVRTMLRMSGTCCTASGKVRKRCDRDGSLGLALHHPTVDHLAHGTAADPNPRGGGPMTFAEVKAQIDSNLPVGVYINWPDNSGHFILISGYLESGGKQYLWVNDPLYNDGPQPYNRVVSNYHLDHGQWQFSYRLKA